MCLCRSEPCESAPDLVASVLDVALHLFSLCFDVILIQVRCLHVLHRGREPGAITGFIVLLGLRWSWQFGIGGQKRQTCAGGSDRAGQLARARAVIFFVGYSVAESFLIERQQIRERGRGYSRRLYARAHRLPALPFCNNLNMYAGSGRSEGYFAHLIVKEYHCCPILPTLFFLCPRWTAPQGGRDRRAAHTMRRCIRLHVLLRYHLLFLQSCFPCCFTQCYKALVTKAC